MSGILPDVAAIDEVPARLLPSIALSLAALQARVAARLTEVKIDDRSELFSIRELVERMPLAEQTVRNLMAAGELREGEHYFRKHRRIAFDWNAMSAWWRARPETAVAKDFHPPIMKVARRGRTS